MKNSVKLIISILIPQAIGMISGIATSAGTKTWYPSLVKPALNPPDWIFAPVWISLYFMMGISLYLVWNKGLNFQGVKQALIIFGIQLFFNFIWSILFFGFHLKLAAFIDIVLLWASIIITIILFSRISYYSAILLVPYFLWVSFASYLNLFLWLLNR